MIRAAIVGTGNIGRREANQIRKHADVQLVAGCDCVPEAVQAFARQFDCRAYPSVEQMLAAERLDLVIVSTTNAGHAPSVIAAAEAGVKNILCEKPLAENLPDALRMVEVTERHGTRTSMGFGWGIHACERYILELVQSGRLGRLMSLYCHGYRGYGFWGNEFRRNPDGTRRHHPAVQYPEISGGWAVHHGCHYIFWLSLLAGPAQTVFGRVDRSTPEAPSEEMVSGLVVFQNGVTGHFADSVGAFRGHECGIVGSRGTLIMHNPHRPEEEIRIRLRYEGEETEEVVVMRPDTDHRTRLDEMLDAIRNNAPSPIPLRVGLENLLICKAVQESSQTGRAVPVEADLALASADVAAVEGQPV